MKSQSTLLRQQAEAASFGPFKTKLCNKTLEQCPYQLEEKTYYMLCYIFSSLATFNIHCCNPLNMKRHKIHVVLDGVDEVGFFV